MCTKFALTLLTLGSLACGTWALIGGTTVDIARHTYMISLRYRRNATDGTGYRHECAGVIYSPRAVLTAAQCLDQLPEGIQLLAVAGATTRNGTDGMPYRVAKWSYHSKYNRVVVDYDIGVVILETPIDLSSHRVSAISLRQDRPAAGRNATAVGWGYREEHGPSSYYLEQVQVPIVSQTQCSDTYGKGEVTERMICAGDAGRDACQGDTGGPLIVEEQLVGLVSWGRGCGRPYYPTVYTYTSSLKQWIDDTVAAGDAL